MRRLSGAVCSMLIVVGCLAPRYEADLPLDAASGTGGKAASSAGQGSTSAGSSVGGGGSSSVDPGGNSSEAGAAGADGTEPSCMPRPPKCSPAQKLCDGACVDIDDPAYGCGTDTCNSEPCPQVLQANFECQAGACVVKDCQSPYKLCSGACIAASDPRYGCGSSGCEESACVPPAGSWLRFCSQGSCDEALTCPAGTKKCGSACVPLDENNSCGEEGVCVPCAANEVCSGSPSKCTCIPDDEAACQGVPCGPALNNCKKTIMCPNKCPSPSVCGTTAGTQNTCLCP